MSNDGKVEKAGYDFPEVSHKLPDLRLMTRVARLYHEGGLNQIEVADRLGLTQRAGFRILKKTEKHGIVRTTVLTPPGTFSDLKGFVEKKFGFNQAIFGDGISDSEGSVLNAMRPAALPI